MYTKTIAACGTFLCLLLTELQASFTGNITTPLRSATNEAVSSVLQEQLADKLLRFHVLADNDSETAQEVKLEVRDAVCTYLAPLMDTVTDKNSAIDCLLPLLDEIRQLANEVLAANGATYHAEVTLGSRYFPIRQYGSFCIPAGTYDTLCIVLGKGEGKNWWCLAFPRFCFVEGTYIAEQEDMVNELKILLTDEEYNAILKQEYNVQIRFRILEWIRDLLRRNDEQSSKIRTR